MFFKFIINFINFIIALVNKIFRISVLFLAPNKFLKMKYFFLQLFYAYIQRRLV